MMKLTIYLNVTTVDYRSLLWKLFSKFYRENEECVAYELESVGGVHQ